MKIILLLILVINPINDLDKIARINAAKKEAELAYLAKDYSLAQEKYLFLKDSLGVNDDKILLNLANSQYLMNDSAAALSNYKLLNQSADRKIASRANQQLGAMEFKNKKYDEALKYYKAALKSDPTNGEARYNYELLKKLIQEQEEQQEQQQEQNKDQEQQEQNKDEQNQDQQKQDQENKEQQEENKQDQEKSEEQKQEEQEQKESQEEQQQEEQKPEDQKEQEKEEQSQPNPIDEEKLKEMQISEEKAMLILEAMKNNEIQYIQQNKRKSKKKKDPSKPDW